MYKYKAGELVELSAAGRKLQHNDKVYDMMGMVLRIDKLEKYPYIIQWFGYNQAKKVTAAEKAVEYALAA